MKIKDMPGAVGNINIDGKKVKSIASTIGFLISFGAVGCALFILFAVAAGDKL